MATVYRLSKDGGTRSARFLGYVRAAKTGAPISGYNPMTSKPALAAVEALMAMRAEERVERIANQIANELGFLDDTDMNLSVSTPVHVDRSTRHRNTSSVRRERSARHTLVVR